MAYPVVEKTWEYATVSNTGSGTIQGDVREILFQWKELLVALSNQPWSVAGSSNGTTGAMDAVDRITSASVILFTGGVSWWMVLEAPSGWGGGQVLVYSDVGGSFASNVHTRWSLSGVFTGGGATTLPTATDDDGHDNKDFINWSGFANGGPTAIHIVHSTDGEHTRSFFCFNSRTDSCIVTETAGDPGDDWDDPRFYGRGPNTNVQSLTTTQLWTVGQEWWHFKVPSTDAFATMTALRELVNGTLINAQLPLPNAISGEYPFWTLDLYGHDIVGARGRCAYLKDWWYTCDAVNPGDGWPGNGDKDFIAFGTGAVLPWNGSTPDMG